MFILFELLGVGVAGENDVCGPHEAGQIEEEDLNTSEREEFGEHLSVDVAEVLAEEQRPRVEQVADSSVVAIH